MEPIWEYTIKLIRFVLNGDVPELPENINFEKLFAFGKSHGVENMLYVGLRDLHIDVPEETMQKFKTAYEMQIMVEATQALELEAISEAFEEAGIDHVPLKGSVIKYLYPMPDYRKSGDIDILIRPEDEAKVDSVMRVLSYHRNKGYDTHEVHFSYEKPPFIEVEIHRQLTAKSARAYKFCKHVWKHVNPDEKKKHLYKLTNEYHYMFLMAHLCRHLYLGGAGIKLFADVYVMNSRCSMNNQKINEYIRKANLTKIHNLVLNMITKWFGDNCEQSPDVEILENIILKNGSFGTMEMRNMMISNMTISAKMKRFIHSLFPSRRLLEKKYPNLKKYVWMLPLIWIYRILDIILFQRSNIRNKLLQISGDGVRANNIKNIVKLVRDK